MYPNRDVARERQRSMLAEAAAQRQALRARARIPESPMPGRAPDEPGAVRVFPRDAR